ncbi:hypothetical protein VNO78_10773 [Psophocarpus tetragonolobus]|uniref:Uncharacterized protein n=1 Tax=Psophocarpus tetragonolobus TaxID=3891 RepID=A0AAN9SL96_PSOTE
MLGANKVELVEYLSNRSTKVGRLSKSSPRWLRSTNALGWAHLQTPTGESSCDGVEVPPDQLLMDAFICDKSGEWWVFTAYSRFD